MKKRIFKKNNVLLRVLALSVCVLTCVAALVPNVAAATNNIKDKNSASVAENVANEGTVLLKNDGVLPFKKSDRVAGMGYQKYDINNPPDYSSVGAFATSMVLGGWGSGRVNTDKCISYYDGLVSAVNDGFLKEYKLLTNGSDALYMDKAIYFIVRYSNEANDKPETAYYLTTKEKNEISALIDAVGKENVVVVLNVGAVMDTTWLLEQNVGAIVLAYYGGEMAGASLASILTGQVTPSGKTVDTWAKAYTDYPAVSVGTSRVKNIVQYTEDIYTGYRYFETFDSNYENVNFEFGFGLSYTSFELSNPVITADENGKITAKINVKNVGGYVGKEVIQVYCKSPESVLNNPSKELVGFAKTGELYPQQSETVTITFDISDAADFDDLGAFSKNSWILQKGSYDFYIGNSVKDAGKRGVVGSFELSENKVVSTVSTSLDTLLYERLNSDGTFETLNVSCPTDLNVSGYGSTVVQAEWYVRSGYASTKSQSFYQGAIGGMGVGNLNNSSAYMEYDLYVEKAGDYNIAFALASFTNATDILTVYVNGVEQSAVTVDINKTHEETDYLWYKSTYVDDKSNVITLPAGNVTLKIASNGSKMVNIDFFTLYNANVSPNKETVIEAENLTSTSLSSKYAHFPDGMATARSVAAGTTYTFTVNAETAGKYFLSLSASNVTSVSANAAKITVNGTDVSEKISLKRTAYGGSDGLSYGTSYDFRSQMISGGSKTIKLDGNSDDFMFTDTDDIEIDLITGENTLTITTLDTAVTCINSITLRPSSMGAANANTYSDNTSDFAGGASFTGATLDTLITYDKLMIDNGLLDEFISQLSIEDLIALSYLEASGEGNINSTTGSIGGNSSTYRVAAKFRVPLSASTDGPAGVRMKNTSATWFPCMTMLASTYNTDLAEDFGNAIALENINGGTSMWLAPGLNIHRDPLCGRNFEYYSEDPLVTSNIASSVVNGVQSYGISVCIKHYFANNQETERHAYDAYISARAIREIYVKPFEETIENSDPWAVMSSYNRVNGEYVACTYDYLNGILRNDWEYDGLIVGDWGSGYSHLSSLVAGNNVKSMYPTVDMLIAAYQSGVITRDILEENAAYVIKYLMKVNMAGQRTSYVSGDTTTLFLTKYFDKTGYYRFYIANKDEYILSETVNIGEYMLDGAEYNVGKSVTLDEGYHTLTFSNSASIPVLRLNRANAKYTEIKYFGTILTEDENNGGIKVSIGEYSAITDENGVFSISVPVSDEAYDVITFEKEGYQSYTRDISNVTVSSSGEVNLGIDSNKLAKASTVDNGTDTDSETKDVSADDGNTGTVIVVIVASVVCLGGIAVAVVLFIKKRKQQI